MTLNDLNKLDKNEARKLLETCCGSSTWLTNLLNAFPFKSEEDLIFNAERTWYDQCSEADWLEAFTHHPKIGDVKSLTEKFASTQHLAGNEQSSVNTASQQVIEDLAKANLAYEQKFGFIFIVCATGKSANEMLRLLTDRLMNTREEELNIAMGEQHKITQLRFKKLLDEANWSFLKVSQLTTHVLDTSIGKPGRDISIRLQKSGGISWQTIAQGVTNADGRIPDLLPLSRNLQPGNYKMVFETAAYFEAMSLKGFYPQVDIQFTIFDNSHYHVPLLINPFGYSTYRGS
ncbi:MAG TPA: 2-oxo-4-hydroxy-4-carboxy-5-ureidoimidazoline decarboxylase [Ferruginibacter sp.]|nr:2-oxo-4-hydroxy-4-carboxy-5-ureidoimidazoline decarboxylase [Ferruginibacter sp.]